MKIVFIIFILSVTTLFADEAEDNSKLFSDAYKQYELLSSDYIENQKLTLKSLRMWRKNRLVNSYSDRLDEIEKNLNLSNKSLIDNFESFMFENGKDSFDDVLMMRLTQLHFEKANLDFNAKMKKYQKDQELAMAGVLAQSPELPVPNYSKSIELAKKFIEKNSNSLLIDKAYYLLGFCNEEMLKYKDAAFYYSQLIQKTPNSPYFDESVWRAADIHFNNQEYSNAATLYKKLTQVESSYELRAIYRLAAVYFSQKEFELAKIHFESLIEKISNLQKRSSEEDLLYDEGLDYLAAIVSHKSDTVLNSKYEPEIFYRLGQIYKKRLDEDSMRIVYEQSLKQFPFSTWSPSVYADLIALYESENNIPKVNALRNELIKLLTANDKWWIQNDSYKSAVFQAQDLLEYSLLKSAQYYANLGYKKEDLKALEVARSRYSNFISKYAWSPYSESAKLELADIEYYLGKYPDASNLYFNLVQNGDSILNREEAAYSLIWSESKKVKYDLNFNQSVYISKDVKKTELTLQENTFIQASQFYTQKILYGERRNKILFKIAEVYAAHGQFDLCISYLNQIISNKDSINLVTLSAYEMLADIYNIKNDWKSVQVVTELANTQSYLPSIEDLDKTNLIQKNKEKISAALEAEMQGQSGRAVDLYEKFLIENSRSDIAPLISLKLVRLYDKLNLTSKMQDILFKLEKTSFSPETAFFKAQMNFKQNMFDDSARLFEEFVSKNKNHIWADLAIMNAIAIRTQMKQYKGIISLFEKTKLYESSSRWLYTYLQALYRTQKYDTVIGVASKYSKKTQMDSAKLLNLVLKSYYAKDDFLSLNKTCPSIKNLNDSKGKTSYLNFNLAFCQFIDLRTIVSVPETRLDQIQVELNEIAAYRVDEVLLQSINVILEYSDLKNQYKEQFSEFANKGWELARMSPFSEESKRLSKNYFQYFSKLPIHLGNLMNWRISTYRLSEFKPIVSPVWTDLKLQCESDSYDCAQGLESLLVDHPKDENLYENLVLAYLNIGEDEKAIATLKKYTEVLDWPQRAVDYYFALGLAKHIPQDKLKYEGQLSSSLGVMAVIERELASGNFKDALKFMRLNFGMSPQYPQTYARAAQFYYEKGYPELSRTILQNGIAASESPLLESLLYQLNAITYSNTRVGSVDQVGDLTDSEKFSLGFSALKSKDEKTYVQMLSLLEKNKNLKTVLRATKALYLNHKQDETFNLGSFHQLWLQRLGEFSNLQNPVNFENLKDISEKGYRHPSFLEIEKISNFRTPAGGI